MNFAEKEAERYRILYEQSLQKAQMQIFQMKNSVDTEDFFIDLHGIHLQEAITILNRRLQQIKVDLGNGKLEPNIGDGRNHVLKIVCGRGIHSKGRPVLKVKIPKFLVSLYFIYNVTCIYRLKEVMSFIILKMMESYLLDYKHDIIITKTD